MKIKELIKKVIGPSHLIAEISALITIIIFMFIVAYSKNSIDLFYSDGTYNYINLLLIILLVILIPLISFILIGKFLNWIYRILSNLDPKFQNQDYLKFILILPFLLILVLGIIIRLCSAFLDAANASYIKTITVLAIITLIIVAIFILRKQIKNIFDDLNKFIFADDRLKSIPIILTTITAGIFIYLIHQSYLAHKLESSIGNDITYYSLGLVVVPLFVFLFTGYIIYKLYIHHRTKAFEKFLTLSTILKHLIFIGLCIYIFKPMTVIGSHIKGDTIVLLVLYLAFFVYEVSGLTKYIIRLKK
jgi:hypothetical protein